MRTIEEIKARIENLTLHRRRSTHMEDFISYDEAIARSENELHAALTASIPLDRLEAICAAERDGRCVVLPAEGEILYKATEDEVVEHMVAGIEITTTEFDDDGFDTGRVGYFCPDDLGKTVFMTRAAASAALHATCRVTGLPCGRCNPVCSHRNEAALQGTGSDGEGRG